MKIVRLVFVFCCALSAHGCGETEPFEGVDDAALVMRPTTGDALFIPPPLDQQLAELPPPTRGADRGVSPADRAPPADLAPPAAPIDRAPPVDRAPPIDRAPPVEPDQAPPPPPPPPPPPGFSPESLRLLELVNEFRATGGRCGGRMLPAAPPLQLDELLEEAAQLHAEDMAENNYFDHQSLDGRSPGDRISAVGYRWRGYGENIAAGQRSVEAAFQGWVDSPGHCANLLRGQFEEMGLGYAQGGGRFGHYWVQKFATPR